jgi:hypothetical protein
MKRLLLFSFSIMIIFASSKHQQTPLTKDEVFAVISRFDEGWENKNMKAVDSALAPSYTYFTQSGGIFSRDSVVATAGETDYMLHDMSRSEIDITLYDNTAIVSTRWKGKGNYRNTPFDEDQRCSIVVVKKDGHAQIISEHCTPIKTNRIFH